MADATPDDLWTPYKYLLNNIENYLLPPNDFADTTHAVSLEGLLRKHKQNFISLLKNPPKNAKCREAIKQGITDGITLPDFGHTMLSKELVDESIIISDMFDVNEYVALELLCTSQQQTVNHPGLTRGLVAVLLYYDGRKSLVASLKQLFKSRAGVSWCTDATPDVTQIITTFTDGLVADGVLERIIDLLQQLDITKELDVLTTNRALGPPKHHRQVLDLFEEIRLLLAQCVYFCAAQAGLPRNATMKLIQYLRGYKFAESGGGIDDVTVTLQMSLLYALDLSVLQRREDGEDLVKQLPMIKDELYFDFLLDALSNGWENDGLHALSLFAFGLSIATLRLAPQTLVQDMAKFIDQDELLVNGALQGKVFDFLYYTFLESELIFETEFFYRRIHTLYTDFIELMHSKVTELRGRADETARTVQLYQQQGIEPPANLCRNFEMLLLSVGKFYGNDRLALHLSVDYWGPTELSHTLQPRSSSRSVCLFKFIRLAGELLPPTLFVPYLKMLAGLSCNAQSARSAFNLLKQGSAYSGSNTISWEHFFNSLIAYYQNLRQEQNPHSETVYRNRMISKSISPQEILGLQAVLQVVQAVAKHDELARVALCEHVSWLPLNVLVGLISCSVPIQLKAEIVHTLASLAGCYENAIQLWHNLEDSQIISTVPSTSNFLTRGVKSELEEVESRNETFPLTQAMLDFLYSLMRTAVPDNLGEGTRAPGVHPYLSYVVDTVLLRLFNRNYKNPAEKWQLAQKCLLIVHMFVKQFNCNSPALTKEQQSRGQPADYRILLNLNTKSELLRLILHILDESVSCFDAYAPFPGKSALEASSLLCLQIIVRALNLQEDFFNVHLNSPNPVILVGLSKLLLGMNPRSGKADHMLNIMKHITYSTWLPENSLVALRILTIIMAQPDVNQLILSLVTQSESLKNEIRQGFVECLEADLNVSEEPEAPTIAPHTLHTTLNSKTILAEDDATGSGQQQQQRGSHETYVTLCIKSAVLHLIQECLQQPVTPNLAHYLLGFDLSKDLHLTNLQQPGIMNFPSNCSKSLITLLDKHLENIKSGSSLSTSYSKLMEYAYRLLYHICRNFHTSEVFLRFLRSCQDFLCRHTAALPFPNAKNPYQLNQMTFLLKSIVIELKLTSERSQATQFETICKILLKTINAPAVEAESAGAGNFYTNTTTVNQSLNSNADLSAMTVVAKESSETAKRLLCMLLDCVNFEIKSLEEPSWNYFNGPGLHDLLQHCEVSVYPDSRMRLIDTRKLHSILRDELDSIHTLASGQRAHIVQEIRTVLQYVVQLNAQRSLCNATTKFLDAWGQVAEVLVSVTPTLIMSLETKQIIITEILQILLSKALPNQVMAELAIIASSTISLLMVNLRSCFMLKSEQMSLQVLSSKRTANGSIGGGGGSLVGGGPNEELNVSGLHHQQPGTTYSYLERANALSLKFILKNILDWLLISSDGSPQLKMNLYVALLNYMYIIKGNQEGLERSRKLQKDNDENGSFLNTTITGTSRKLYNAETEDSKQLKMIMDIFNSFGDNLINVICQDCTTGHDICKMLAMSCLDMLLSMDSSVNIVEFVARHGYLSHIVNSLLKNDGDLCRILQTTPSSFRALYVYESKMALLSRLARCQVGARLLLEERILGVLGSMKVYDMHPDVQLMHGNSQQHTYASAMAAAAAAASATLSSSFIPPVEVRFQQILFPALNLCDAILSTLGQENNSALSQIIHFFLSHSDMIETVLRVGSPLMNLGLLKELAGVTNLIARAANQEIYELTDPNANQAYSQQMFRFQKFMLALLPRFIVSEQTLKDLHQSSMLAQPYGSGGVGIGISSSVNATLNNGVNGNDQKHRSQHLKYFLEVAANLALYVRNCISNHVVDHRTINVLFSPHYTGSEGASAMVPAPPRPDALRSATEASSSDVPHSLYVVITQLRCAVEFYNHERNVLESLQQQRNSLPSIDLDKNIQLQHSMLTERVNEKQDELQRIVFIIEHYLYILWAHLDFFMLRLMPVNTRIGSSTYSGHNFRADKQESSFSVSNEDIVALKKALIGVFNETFCKQLIEIDQKQAEKGFVAAFIRRIKQSIQFVPLK
ncbi:nuclear pore complex protein Nup205 [Anopheles ziemanni]|uniref:nuclear pore complex protein Nup205 n=1 Tax=Anopheles coustani TaxID=139045 RepID=UPI002659F812|nr:nuclear pore complex protein Nup205 [Anopheles coustani]XP_058167450.1 nuclear pore complex protein Nup205 [Anopheles ziemanni]